MVMNPRRSLLRGSGMVEVFFSVVASTYFVKEDYLMKHEIPVMWITILPVVCSIIAVVVWWCMQSPTPFRSLCGCFPRNMWKRIKNHDSCWWPKISVHKKDSLTFFLLCFTPDYFGWSDSLFLQLTDCSFIFIVFMKYLLNPVRGTQMEEHNHFIKSSAISSQNTQPSNLNDIILIIFLLLEISFTAIFQFEKRKITHHL